MNYANSQLLIDLLASVLFTSGVFPLFRCHLTSSLYSNF